MIVSETNFPVSQGDPYRVSVHAYKSGNTECKLVMWKSNYDIPPWVREENAKNRKPAGPRARSWDEMTPEQRAKASDNVLRAKGRVRRLAMALNTGRLMTWTYRENYTDSTGAWRDFSAWVKLFRARYPKFQYVATQEVQKRGAMHFHAIVRSSDRSDWIDVQYARSCWLRVVGDKEGTINVRPMKDRSRNGIARACSYVAKYITKDVSAIRPGGKRYRCSEGIVVPTKFYWITALSWQEAKIEFYRRFERDYGIPGSVFLSDYDCFAWAASWSFERHGRRRSSGAVAVVSGQLVAQLHTPQGLH